MTENKELFPTDLQENESSMTEEAAVTLQEENTGLQEEAPAANEGEAEVLNAENTEALSEEDAEEAADEDAEITDDGDSEAPNEEDAEAAVISEEKEGKGKTIKKVAAALVSVVVVVALTLFLTPRIKYGWAMQLAKIGKADKAYEILSEIDGSYEKAEQELKRFVKVYSEETYSQNGSEPQKATIKCKVGKNTFKKTIEVDGASQTIEQTFDNKGNIIKEIEKDSSGTETVSENTYDKNGNCIKTVMKSQGQEATYERTFDKDGNCIKTVYSANMGEMEYKVESETKNYKTYYVKKK